MRKPTLYNGEHVIIKTGIHWKNYILPTLSLLFIFLLLCVRIKYYGQPLFVFLSDTIATGYWRMISFAECLLLLWFLLSTVVRIIKISKIGYYVTDRRIIMAYGWLTLHSNEMMLKRCDTVNLKMNLYERFFNTGDLFIVSAGASIVFDDVPRAEQFKATIQQILMERDDAMLGSPSAGNDGGWNFS